MFPPDIWPIFFSYLSSQQIATFQFISQDLYTITNRYMQHPAFWQPLFHQLSFMPPYPSINPYDNPTHDFKTAFKNTIAIINLQQIKEIQRLQSSNFINLQTLEVLQFFNTHAVLSPTSHLSTLTIKHQYLEKINYKNILSNITTIKKKDPLDPTPITRTPLNLKNKKKVKIFFNSHYKNLFNTSAIFFNESNLAILHNFIQCGTNINTQNDRGQTCLHVATLSENIPLIQTLIQLGANVNAINNHYHTPLHAYIKSKKYAPYNIDIIRYLIVEGKTNIESFGIDGHYVMMDIIHHAAHIKMDADNCIEPLKCFILEGKGDVHLKNHGNTLLHFSIKYFSVTFDTRNLISCLVNTCGADINVKNTKGNTPLIYALKKLKTPEIRKIITHLIQLGADVNLTDNNGCTPFDLAISHNHSNLSHYLETQNRSYRTSFIENTSVFLTSFPNMLKNLLPAFNHLSLENRDNEESESSYDDSTGEIKIKPAHI